MTSIRDGDHICYRQGELQVDVILQGPFSPAQLERLEALVQRTFEHAAGCPVCRQGGKYETV